MQEELTKHTRKIFKSVKNHKKTLLGKSAEILIEVLIIVFSVSLSIWLHGWSEHRHQQKETVEFLADMKDDLLKDIDDMNAQKARRLDAIRMYEVLKGYTRKQVDSLTWTKSSVNFAIDMTIRKTNNGNYEGFRSSGKIGYIENKKLKKLILEYYQDAMPSLEAVENYYNDRVNKTEGLITGSKKSHDLFLDPVVKNSLNMAMQIAQNNVKAYEDISKLARDICVEIDKGNAEK